MAYRLQFVELRCPWCRGELAHVPDTPEDSLACTGCSRNFPIVCGIPDLRVFPDPYISFEGDRTKARMLHSRFADRDFAGIVELYYHITPETPPHDVVSNTTRLLGAVSRAEATLEAWDGSFGVLEGRRLLDVGCGTAPLLVASSRRFANVLGVDVGLRWLVVARRRLLELGLDIPLVAACGEALPFAEGEFDAVTMDSFIEIAADQEKATAESLRVLRSAGELRIATPNRFSVGPDPHIGVPAGGFLPSVLVGTIAKQRMARPPRRHFLSAASLRRLLERGGYSHPRVAIPPVSDGQQAQFGSLGRRAAGLYNSMRRLPVARQLLHLVGPMLIAGGRKP